MPLDHSTPTTTIAERYAGQILVDQLVIQGVREVFCVPGESFLPVLDALVDSPIQTTTCRQEGGACMMAEAVGKLSGEPGVCFVTRGPGATNASPGIHIAKQDSTPMVLFVGQIERAFRGREAFQEIDIRAVFGSMAKWATEIEDPARIPEIVSQAFHIATSGRPGPVVVGLPEDVLFAKAAVKDSVRYAVNEVSPRNADMATLKDLISKARSPIAVVGGSRWSQQAVDRFVDFAARCDIPVAVGFRRQMLFPADHPNFAGDLGLGPNPALVSRVRESDLVLAVGTRLSDIVTQGYAIFDIPNAANLVHIHPDPAVLGATFRPKLAINASPNAFCERLGELAPAAGAAKSRAAEAHAAYLQWSDTSKIRTAGPLQMAEVITFLRERLPADAVVTNGAGNYATWIHRFYRFRRFGTQLAPTSGSMGYGVPAAIGAKRAFPERTVIAFAGDGCFLMHGQEFATAVQFRIPVVIVLVDNGMYGTIRMHQERTYPGRISATDLKNPDFAQYARAFGGHGETVKTTAEFAPAFERAVASGMPSIIHCLLDPEAITPTTSLSAMRKTAEEALRAARSSS